MTHYYQKQPPWKPKNVRVGIFFNTKNMNNVRNLFQILCILALLVTLTNCQNENSTDLVTNEALQKEFPYTTSLLSQLEIETNTKLSTTMRNFATIQSQSIAENSTSYDFTIHTDVVKLIESTNSNAHSYTFPIERPNYTGSELENVVFSYDVATDSYDAHLVTYHLSAAQKQELLQSQHISSAYDVSHQEIALNFSDVLGESTMPIPCNTIYTTYHITPAPDENTYLYAVDGVLQGVCEHEQDDDPCDTYTVIEIECPDGGSDGSGYDTTDNTSNDPYSSPNNTADGGGTTSNDDGGDDATNIVTSLLTKEESLEITQIMNDVVGQGNWRFDDTAPEDAPNFNSQQELEAFFETLVSGNFTTESSEFLDPQQSTRRDRHVMHFSSFPSASIKASVKLQVPDANTPLSTSDILNVRTTVQGSTTLFKWTQLDDEDMSSANTSPNVEIDQANNRLRIQVEGNMEIGFRLLGTLLTRDESIIVELVYNLTTGELIPQYSRWFYDI